MTHASTLRLAHALPLAFGLAFVWPEAADAGRDQRWQPQRPQQIAPATPELLAQAETPRRAQAKA